MDAANLRKQYRRPGPGLRVCPSSKLVLGFRVLGVLGLGFRVYGLGL